MPEILQQGDTVGGYVLDGYLGGGGFGSVWRAHHPQTNARVAIKILHDEYYGEEARALRAEIEVLAATAASRSPHVVKVLGGGVEPQPYVVMEYIEGIDLSKELARRKTLPQHETIRICTAVVDAMRALAEVGIVHRDIKPGNVLLDQDRRVRLADFGIAKILGFNSVSQSGHFLLTAPYAAPELWEGVDPTFQSDFYAFGCMLFQCLAGRTPFVGKTPELQQLHRTAQAELGLLPGETVPALRTLIADCLAKSPSSRPKDAAEIITRLKEAEAELTVSMQHPAVPLHEPTALEHWVIEEKHPTRPWTFRCRHDATGEKATVEVHFSEELSYGEGLQQAVRANAKLVSLGAERLIGSNRLILRPGEGWKDPPPGRFQFWVAREELPVQPGPAVVTADLLRKAAAGIVALVDQAEAAGLMLRPSVADPQLNRHGEVLLSRPGLPPYEDSPDDAFVVFLKGLRLDAGAAALLAGVTDVASLRELASQPPGELSRVITPSLGHPGGSGEPDSELVIVPRVWVAEAARNVTSVSLGMEATPGSRCALHPEMSAEARHPPLTASQERSGLPATRPYARPAIGAEPGRGLVSPRQRSWFSARNLVIGGVLVLLVVAFLAIRASFMNFKVDGNSMYPTLENGEFLIVNELDFRFRPPSRGDIVVLKDPREPQQDLIKRIIGLPGETLEIRDGKVYIDERYLEEPYIKSAWHDSKSAIVLGQDEYFVMGDNRENSLDSRSMSIGLIHKDLIIGKAMLSYWPTSALGLAPNGGGTLANNPTPGAAATPTLTLTNTPTLTRTATAGPPKGPSATSGKTYTVKAGDSCGSIAATSKITLGELLDLNKMTEDDCPRLQVGQTLKLP